MTIDDGNLHGDRRRSCERSANTPPLLQRGGPVPLTNKFGALPEEHDDTFASSPAQDGGGGRYSLARQPALADGDFGRPSYELKRDRQRARRAARQLGILCRERADGPLVAPVTAAARPAVIEVVVDSGAEDSVTPPNLFPGEVLPSPMSRAGRSYRAANGSPIPNLGQLVAHFKDPDGRACGIPFQVAEVERPLLSVSRLAEAGCQVSFKDHSGEILHVATGRKLPLVRRGGVYLLQLRGISSPGGLGSGRKPTSPFPRQGQ